MPTTFKRVRIIGLFTLVILVTFLGLIPIIITYRISPLNHQISDKLLKLDIILTLDRLIERVKVRFYLLDRDLDSDRVRMLDILNKSIKYSETKSKYFINEHFQKYKELRRDLTRLRAAIASYYEEYRFDPAGSTTVEMRNIVKNILRQADAIIADYRFWLHEDIRALQKNISSLMYVYSIPAAFLGLFGIIFGLIVIVLMSNALNKPIKGLVEVTRRISSGDLDYSNLLKINDDELGQIAGALTEMSLDLKRAREKSISEKKLLEEANKSKDILLANASHELRTPLMAIMGYASLMKSGNNIGMYIDKISNEAKVLTDMINMLLDLTCIETGVYKINKKVFSLRKVMEECAGRFEPAAGKKGIEFSSRISDRIPAYVSSDPIIISQIVDNFLSNAVKYTAKGSIVLAAELVNNEAGCARVKFSVKDTGIGISNEKQNMIFQKFVQLEEGNTRRYGGMGLGLYIVKLLVNLLDGWLGVSSKEGAGSEFWCELPLAEADSKDLQEDLNASGEKIEAAYREGTEKYINILLAEDHDQTREVVETYLSQFGFVITGARNGEEAVQYCKNKKFDMILMDLQMPVVDGYSAAEAIREIDKHYMDIPIIALTARIDPPTKGKCLKAGITDIISKPVEVERIMVFVERYLHYHINVKGKAAGTDAGSDKEAERSTVIDFTRLLVSFADDEKSAMKAVGSFIASLKTQSEILKRASRSNDYEAIKKEAHRMLGGARTLAMGEIAVVSASMEDAAEAASPDSVNKAIDEFDIALKKADEWIVKKYEG